MGIYGERLRRERDLCELHDLLLSLANAQFDGRFTGFQYASGVVGPDEGRRAADLMAQGIKDTEKIIAWTERFPEEQKSLLGGWKSYYGSYIQVLSASEKMVREKLAKEK